MASAKKKLMPAKKARGRTAVPKAPPEPKHEPTEQTRAIVERASLTGKLTHDDIGALIGISDVTLRKYYPAELRTRQDDGRGAEQFRQKLRRRHQAARRCKRAEVLPRTLRRYDAEVGG